MITLSRGPFARNFDIGQEDDHVRFRLRTAVSGSNGEIWRAETGSVIVANAVARIVATYDGSVARLYVDGTKHARLSLASTGCHVRNLCDAGLPVAWGVLGAATALIVLAVAGTWGRARTVATCVFASASLLAIERAIGLMPPAVHPPMWVLLCAPACALAIALARVEPSAIERR